MDLREMIREATNLLPGGQKELADRIGVLPQQITDAKSGRQKLPNSACGKLGEILGIDRWTVVAASDLVTEKNPERRAYLAPFLNKAAAILMIFAFGLVTLFVTSNPAQASYRTVLSSHQCALCQINKADNISNNRIAQMKLAQIKELVEAPKY